MLEQLNILVIEDNLEYYLLIEKYLEEELPGVTVMQVSDYITAKERLGSKHAFDAVLLDLSLPDDINMDELVENILQHANNIPVIVLTGDNDNNFGVKNLSKGVSDYLLKEELNAGILCRSVRYSIERKKIQIQLEQSEEKYRSLFDASPLPIWVLDRENLRFLSVNKAAVQLYGYTREEFLSMSVKDLWAPNQEDHINKVVNANHNNFFRLQVRHHTKDGELIYVIVKSNPVIFDGIPSRVSLVNNITARLEAEEKLIQSEQRFKSLVQEGSDLISILDGQLNFIYCSPASKTVLGVEPEEILGKNFTDYVHKADYENIQPHLEKLKKSKSLQLPSYRIKNSAGEWRWIETIITDLKNDEAIGGMVMNSRDITDFIYQEKKLLESLERYNIVAKATSDLITDYDIENDEITVSDSASEMFGYPIDKKSRKSKWWNEKIHPEDFEKVKLLISKMYKKGTKNLTTEYRFRSADGSYKYILDRSYLISDEQGNPKRVIASMQDITERKRHLIAIEEHNERLKEIAWTQSHVVRAPLAKVIGLVDLLKNYKNDLENVDEILENILNSSKELDAIIRKIAQKTENEL